MILLQHSQPFYGGAILIIRNPFDAFVAEWTRKNAGGHTGTVSETLFGMLCGILLCEVISRTTAY